jgi:hypothetical protein
VLFDYFKQVVTFHKLEKVGNVIDVSQSCPSAIKDWFRAHSDLVSLWEWTSMVRSDYFLIR